MDPRLYRAVICSGTNLDLLTRNQDKFSQVTGSGNTVLHLASQYGRLEAVKLFISLNKDLLLMCNRIGENALHHASKAGHVSVVRALIDSAMLLPQPQPQPEGDIESHGTLTDNYLIIMLRQGRHCDGYTALHEAVRYHHVDVAKMLIEADPHYSYPVKIYQAVRIYDDTPLYLAARRGFHELVSVILDTCKSPAFVCPNGATALHGAIISNSKECVGLLLRWKPILHKARDNYGKTPLHYAAHLGYADMVSLLILIDFTCCYAKDEFGNTALHIAASQGHVSVMKELVLHSPDCWDMVDAKHQNILHIAVIHRKEDVIQYILQQEDFDKAQLINQQDIHGNTPLHLISISDYFVPQLILHPLVDHGVLNYSHKTALDLVITYDHDDKTKENLVCTPYKFQNKIAEELKSTGATFGLPYTIKTKQKPEQKMEQREKIVRDPLEHLQKTAKTQIIVTTLVATITFAAGFTMPGGYIQSDGSNDDKQAGMSVLTKSVAFQVFILSDTIAFLLSTAAISMYYVASVHAVKKRIFRFLFVAIFLNMGAVLATMVAFITGTYAVLRNSAALALAVCLLGSCYFVIYIALALIFLFDFLRGKIYLLTL